MASLDGLKIRKLLSRGVIGQVGDDLSVVFSLKYKGVGSVTSVVVTTATDITLTTSDGGTDVYDWATYTTVGALVAKINAAGIFEAKILDSLKSTPTGSGLFIAGTLTANSDGEYNVMSDTSNAKFLAYRLTFDRKVGENEKLAAGHRVEIQEIITDITLGGGADANGLKIYEITPKDKGMVERIVYQKTPTSGSISTTNWASGNGKITANDGNDLLLMVSDATSVTGNFTLTGIVE